MGHWWTEGVAPLLRGLAAEGAVARPIVAVRPSGLTALCHSMARAEQAWVAACGFVGAAGEVLALPGEAGIARVLLGLGDGSGPFAFGGLAERLARARGVSMRALWIGRERVHTTPCSASCSARIGCAAARRGRSCRRRRIRGSRWRPRAR